MVAAHAAGLEPLQGHGIRIRVTLFHLLRGIPMEAVKVMGRWSSNTFLHYLQKHAQILTPLGLGTSGSTGDLDPYPWVFWAPKVIPGSVKISHGSPRAMGQKPTGPQVPMGIPVSTIKK